MVYQLKEISVGKSKLFLRDDDILTIVVVGDINATIAEGICEAARKLKEGIRISDDAKILVDNTLSGKQSPEARRIFEFQTKEGQDTVAIFGLHPVARVLASFFIKTFSKGKSRFFSSQEEAVNWLLSKSLQN
jgi:hypothetical protein